MHLRTDPHFIRRGHAKPVLKSGPNKTLKLHFSAVSTPAVVSLITRVKREYSTPEISGKRQNTNTHKGWSSEFVWCCRTSNAATICNISTSIYLNFKQCNKSLGTILWGCEEQWMRCTLYIVIRAYKVKGGFNRPLSKGEYMKQGLKSTLLGEKRLVSISELNQTPLEAILSSRGHAKTILPLMSA